MNNENASVCTGVKVEVMRYLNPVLASFTLKGSTAVTVPLRKGFYISCLPFPVLYRVWIANGEKSNPALRTL